MTRTRPASRFRRASDRSKIPLRRPDRSFEVLESRFLLSTVASLAPIPLVEVQTSQSSQISQTIPTQLIKGSSTPLAGPTILDSNLEFLQDESFSLNSGDTVPSVQVSFILIPGTSTATGRLVVSNTSSGLFYNVPLSDVEALHAELPIPSASGTTSGATSASHLSTTSSASTLGIDLLISPSATRNSTTGSFQLAIYWNQDVPLHDPLGANFHPQSLNTPTPPSGFTDSVSTGSETPALVTPFSITYPSIVITEVFPSPNNSPQPESRTGGGTTLVTGPPQTNPPGATGSTGNSSSTNTRPTGVMVPIAVDHAAGGAVAPVSPSGRAANVGPLPLSELTSDGGIFAFPNSVSRTSELSIAPTNTVELTPVAVVEKGRQSFVEVVQRFFAIGSTIPSVPRMIRKAAGRPSEIELSSLPARPGATFLPPISELAAPAKSEQPESRSRSETTPVSTKKSPRIVPIVPSLAVALIGSASLWFGLTAPDCVASLSYLREEARSSGRRLVSRFNSRSKRASEPS